MDNFINLTTDCVPCVKKLKMKNTSFLNVKDI